MGDLNLTPASENRVRSQIFIIPEFPQISTYSYHFEVKQGGTLILFNKEMPPSTTKQRLLSDAPRRRSRRVHLGGMPVLMI